jgi:hypothetical protein
MATMGIEDQKKVWRGLMRHWSRPETVAVIPNMLKADLLSAVQATDQWIDGNQAAYNAALPEVFRNNASMAQKTLLFCMVALARVSIAMLRQVIGEVE